MRLKENLQALWQKVDDKFFEQFGFKIKHTTFNKVVDYMYSPRDASSLAVTRILFGLMMVFDVPDERGGAMMDKRWGDPSTCHFPLFPILTALPLPYMALVYAALWIGAFCIMLGYQYRIAAPMFTACYWYLLLIDKSFWNNHSYLFGLIALLLSCTEANCYWSLDVSLDPSKKKSTVPYWNYFVLKYQLFILYFFAGVRKGSAEWLSGYSVQNLSEHWIFSPFTYFFSVPQIDYYVVHWFVFLFDLTVALWMMLATTRHCAMLFCGLFHLMNSRLFTIGMFPWVCLATMPLFYQFDWPKRMLSYLKPYYTSLRNYIYNLIKLPVNGCLSNGCKDNANASRADLYVFDEDLDIHNEEVFEATEPTNLTDETDVSNELNKHNDDFESSEAANGDEVEILPENNAKSNYNNKNKLTIYLIIIYAILQAFLPYSHFITKGYNNWTDGLYGYSWDMMVHTWDNSFIVINVVDNDQNKEMYINPQQYTLNDRWTRHGDMLHQYAQCLKNNLQGSKAAKLSDPPKVISSNISVYTDIWYSLNGRFVQRMFNSKVDLLKAEWSPFSAVPYLMPLLNEAEYWRSDLDQIRSEVYSWNNKSDVVFLSEFPGYEQEKYIPAELENVTLTVLEGSVVYEPQVAKNEIGQSFKLIRGNQVRVHNRSYHKIGNVENKPAFFMYTFLRDIETQIHNDSLPKTKLPILKELYKRLSNMFVFFSLIVRNFLNMFKVSQCSL